MNSDLFFYALYQIFLRAYINQAFPYYSMCVSYRFCFHLCILYISQEECFIPHICVCQFVGCVSFMSKCKISVFMTSSSLPQSFFCLCLFGLRDMNCVLYFLSYVSSYVMCSDHLAYFYIGILIACVYYYTPKGGRILAKCVGLHKCLK